MNMKNLLIAGLGKLRRRAAWRWARNVGVGSALLAFGLAPSASAQITNLGHALFFDGTTDGAVVRSGFSGFPGTDITVELWVRSTNTTKAGSLVSFATAGSANTFLIYDHRNLTVWINNASSEATGVSLNDGGWHHLAVTWSTSGTLQLFKDGVLAYSTNNHQIGAQMGTFGTLVLGQDQDTLSGGFDAAQAFLGEIKEVRIWSVVRTPEQIAQNFTNQLPGATTMLVDGTEPGLEAYFRCNEGIGPVARDATLRNGAASLGSGIDWVALAPYNAGSALDFVGGYVEVPNSPAFNAYPMSFTAWLRTSADFQSAMIANRAGALRISLENGQVAGTFSRTDGNFVDIMDGTPVNDGLWHHLAMTVDASGGRVYVDGILRDHREWSGTPGAPSSTSTLLLGFSGALGLNGQMDEVALWNVALDPVAVQNCMNRRLTGTDAGLVALYHFDEESGFFALDSSANAQNGVLVNNMPRVNSGARISGLSQIRGRLVSGASGLPNTLVSALSPPITVSPSQSIPDNGTVTSTNPVTRPGTFGAVQVNLNITHSFRGDLEITLIHPDGTEVRLQDPDATDDRVNLVTSYPNLTPTAASLAVLNGKPLAGNWRLRVRDAYPADTGVLNSWSLQFGPSPVLTDATGNYVFSNLFTGTFTVQPERDGFVFNPPSIVTPVDRTNVNFAVTTGFISGRVTNAAGGLAGLVVRAAGGPDTHTDANGFYRLAGLAAGNQTISATNFGYSIVPVERTNVPLGTTNADFGVLAYPVAGRVTDPNSNGVAGITVAANSSITPATTDGNGNYVIPEVLPGNAFITAVQAGYTFAPPSITLPVNSAVSNVNFMAVSSPPTLTTIPNQVIARNGTTGPLRFDVNDAETRPALLRVMGISSNPSLVPNANLLLEGVGVQRTVTVTPATNQFGTATIVLTVTDESGLKATSSFVVRVNQLPEPGIGLALNLNGVNQSASAATGVIGDKGTFSVEAWTFAPSNAGPRTLIAQGPAFTIGVDATGQVRIGTNWNTGVSFPFGAWRHVAVVREAANTRLYLDGVLVASRGSALPFPSPNTPFQVGALDNSEFWLGQVDEVRVWRVARPAGGIAEYRTVRVTGNEPDLAGLWRMDERTGAVASNTVPAGLHLTLSGATRVPSPLVFNPYRTLLGRNISDQLQGYDADGDPLTFALVSPPTRGALTLLNPNTGAFLYAANGTGEDVFTFSVSDGYATSAAHPVTIQIGPDTNAPSISFLADQTMDEDTVLGPVAFTVGDTERAADLLVVFGQSSYQALVPDANIVINGTGNNRTFSLLPATNQFGTATIRLIVSDGSQQATNSFTLTVLPVNDPPGLAPMTNEIVTRGQLFNQLIVATDVDTPAASLLYSASSSNPTLVSGYTDFCQQQHCVSMSSSGSQSGIATITVSVTDGATTNSTSFQVRVNNPPTIAAIPNQSTFRNFPTAPIAITLADVDDPVASAVLTASSSNQAVVDDSSFSFSGTGANRTLVITPIGGRVGQTTITVTARDAFGSSSRTFQVVVEQLADYTITDLGAPGGGDSYANDINDAGQIAGTFKLPNYLNRAFRWQDGQMTELRSASASQSFGRSINNLGDVGGSEQFSIGGVGEPVVFYGRGGSVRLGVPPGAFSSDVADLNDAGVAVVDAGFFGPFVWSGNGYINNPLPTPQNPARINNAGEVVMGSGLLNDNIAVLRLSQAGLVTVGTFGSFGGNPGHMPWSVNELGDVLATLQAGEINQQTVLYPFIFNFKTGRLQTNLLTSAGERPRALEQMKINDAGEAVFSGILTGTAPNAYLYAEGRLINLNNLMPPNSPFVLLARANAINNVGDIVGEGVTSSGKTHGFLMSRRWEVGQPLSPPLSAIDPLTSKVHRPPNLEALDGTSVAEFATAYLWSDFEQKLFFVRPVAAKIIWATSSNPTDTNAAPVVTRVRAEWPLSPQIHIATAPVALESADGSSPHRAIALPYSTSTGVSFDASSRTFNASGPGYSVIRYLIAPEVPIGGTPNLLTHSNYFEVVRTVAWNDPRVLRDNLPATVGTKVSDPRGPGVATNSFKSGWTVNAISPYDGVGVDRAYDRATQTGPIIPVNRDTAAADDDLVVAFYKKNTLTGALWPDLAARFNISWPANAATLVIANPEGSGPLPEAQYPDKQIYHQPNSALPGFNPNEEHAFLAPTSAGQGVFALRNDLNRPNTSSNYVLLKYRNPTNSEWAFKLYRTALLDATHDLVFTGEVGKEILPPYPLGLFPVCGGTTNWAGQAFRDHRGKFYAAQGPTPENPYPQVRMHYFYPLQPDFYFDRNGDGVNDVPPGSCIRWEGIGQFAVSPTAQPVDVTYRIRWPAETPTLQTGETLLTAKNGLPGIKNWASAQIVYDSLNPDGLTPLASAVRLYDPLSARVLRLTNVAGISASYQFPPEVALQTVGGKQVFSDLPFHLRSRLSFDPVNKWLSFAGFLDDTVLGEPLLLVNVLSGKERDRLKQLSGEANFQRIVDALYDLTRNPNSVNVTRPGEQPPSQELLIGFTTKYTAQVTNLVTTNVTVQEFFGVRPIGNNLGFLATNIVQEPLGDLPKALTAGLPVPSQSASFGRALQFDGSATAFANTQQPVAAPQTFTMSLWFRTTATQIGVLLGFGDNATTPFGAADRTLYINGAGALSFYVWDGSPNTITSTNTFRDGQWHHAAATFSAATGMRLYVDGLLVAQNPNVTVAYTYPSGGYWRIGQDFNGTIDDVQIWNVVRTPAQIQSARSRPLTGGEAGLIRYWRFDEIAGSGVRDSTENRADAWLFGNWQRVASTVPATGAADRFVVLAENNDPALGALPVTLHVIRLDGGPFGGDLKIIYPDNVFDERLTLRHSSDFGADPDRLEFEWWYHPDNADFNPTALPIVNADGSIANARGWLLYSPALTPNKFGQNTITIGDGGETSQFTLADNWFISRYRGYSIGGQTKWSDWVGDPASAELKRAAFAPGWVKRVIEGINPFEDRTKDFHNNPAGTFASMLIQAGTRYEGNIALNPSGDNLSSIGLIEAYTTVMHRAISLSIEGVPPVDSDPLNTALLLAASRISDLYMLLGNEAFADAQDPTIGFLSGSSELGTLATASFAFKNQLDSLLEEELVLLRGRDDSAAGVGARPVYNRVLWNFTGSEGEVAYQRTYNIGDVNRDGVINEFDAKILFPQGHGDAWGHYLTALKTYYGLLRHPRFTWIPRPENVLIGGVAVKVDFLDERKFATAAKAKAKAGSEIVDLTYRSKFVDDPEGQYQGYKDTRADRAWGVTEWARRTGQGAYFDWLVGNAILPSTDPNTNHVGIQKIDRQTVRELDQIISEHLQVQAQLDKSDAGLNPLGLAKGAVPFDIDPNFDIIGSGIQGQRHFQQIYDRAVRAMNNAVAVWNQANQLSEALRQQQDTIDEFSANIADQERDYKSRLIEIFGYPYAGDIGAGKTYPSGYDGPDIYHYMYVNTTELTGAAAAPTNILSGLFAPFADGTNAPSFYFGDDFSAGNFSPGPVLDVQFPMVQGGWAFTAPASYGSRRAPGELQLALSDLLQEETRLKIALGNYDAIIRQIRDAATLLQSRSALSNQTISLLSSNQTKLVSINQTIEQLQDAQLGLRRVADASAKLSSAVGAGIPGTPIEIFAPLKGAAIGVLLGVSIGVDIAADVVEGQQNRQERAKEETQLQTDLQIEIASQDYEIKQQAAELLSLFRDEGTLRLEAFNQAELVNQSFGRFQAALATGQRLLEERVAFRQRTAGTSQQARYQDMAFRIFRNEALQKYRAQFDLAARYVYLAATAYDYELNFLGTDNRSGRDFFTDIIRQRSLGQMIAGEPVAGGSGLADALGRLNQNFAVLQSRFGLNNPQLETSRFSLRKELFRIKNDSDAQWRAILRQSIVPNLWDVPEFRRHCRPFAPESAGPQPGLVIRFPTTITFGLNFFGFPLGGGDSAYDPSLFTTKINSVGLWFEDYNSAGLATAPRVYLVPAGMDVQRSPTGNTLATREWRVMDQVIPVPFPIGASSLTDPSWIPMNDSLAETFGANRRFSSFRAYHDSGVYDDTESTRSTRLIGRSVWNTDWVLIIPGGTFLFDPSQGIETFINSVSDIKLSLQSYSYSGD